MSIKLKGFCALGFAVIILSSVVVSVIVGPTLFYEMTFISNALAGVILLVGAGVNLATGKDLPQWLYLDAATLLVTVVLVCGIFAPVPCFANASVVLHLINPALMCIFYLTFCKTTRADALFTALIVPVAYYVFMMYFGVATGNPVYIYFDTTVMSKSSMAVYGVVSTFAVVGICSALFLLNRQLRERSRNRRIT